MQQSLTRIIATLVAIALHGTAMGAMIVVWSPDEATQVSAASVVAITMTSVGDEAATQEEAAPLATDSAQSAAAEESHLGTTATIAQDESQPQAAPSQALENTQLEQAIKEVESEKLSSEKEVKDNRKETSITKESSTTDITRERQEMTSMEGSDVQRNAQEASSGGIGSLLNGEGKAKASGGAQATASYARIVVAELTRHKNYPLEARNMNAVGTVSLTFTIGEAGHIITHTVTRSSGHPVLDEAARTMLTAARFPPPPGGKFTASIPVRFEKR